MALPTTLANSTYNFVLSVCETELACLYCKQWRRTLHRTSNACCQWLTCSLNHDPGASREFGDTIIRELMPEDGPSRKDGGCNPVRPSKSGTQFDPSCITRPGSNRRPDKTDSGVDVAHTSFQLPAVTCWSRPPGQWAGRRAGMVSCSDWAAPSRSAAAAKNLSTNRGSERTRCDAHWKHD